MGEQTMMEYLSEIKSKCNGISTLGSILSIEDVVLYTLNGVPSGYQDFKTVIRTNLQPIGFDDFYALLCSEELNIAAELEKEYHTKIANE